MSERRKGSGRLHGRPLDENGAIEFTTPPPIPVSGGGLTRDDMDNCVHRATDKQHGILNLGKLADEVNALLATHPGKPEPHEQAISWFQSDDCWMARQSIAIVGKIWPAMETSKGAFYWTATSWATKDANGKSSSGYAPTIDDARREIESLCAVPPTPSSEGLREALAEAIECVGEFVDVYGNEWHDGTPLNTKYEQWKAALAAPGKEGD